MNGGRRTGRYGWVIAAALAAALACPAAGQYYGLTNVDLGHAPKGHVYSYVLPFVNHARDRIMLRKARADCGLCPTVAISQPAVMPRETTDLVLTVPYDSAAADTLDRNIYLVTDDGRQQGEWNIRIRARATANRLIDAGPAAMITTADSSGVSGGLTVRSISDRPLSLVPAGAPAALRWSRRPPFLIGPRDTAALVFSAPAGALLRHHSLTFEARAGKNGPTERFSVPIIVK